MKFKVSSRSLCRRRCAWRAARLGLCPAFPLWDSAFGTRRGRCCSHMESRAVGIGHSRGWRRCSPKVVYTLYLGLCTREDGGAIRRRLRFWLSFSHFFILYTLYFILYTLALLSSFPFLVRTSNHCFNSLHRERMAVRFVEDTLFYSLLHPQKPRHVSMPGTEPLILANILSVIVR